MSVEVEYTEPVFKDIKNKTEEFFQLHWNNGEDVPKWSDEIWKCEGKLSNEDKRGCYALLLDETVKYIGVGISRGAGIYVGHGLGARTAKYTKGRGEYKFNDEWKGKVDGIATIGFPEERVYMAATLEVYLIGALKPEHNKVKYK